jgi:hypothetical protein
LPAAPLSTLLVAASILDFDVDAAGPNCISNWMWFDDFILQFSLPILVRAHRRSPLIRLLRRSFALLN